MISVWLHGNPSSNHVLTPLVQHVFKNSWHVAHACTKQHGVVGLWINRAFSSMSFLCNTKGALNTSIECPNKIFVQQTTVCSYLHSTHVPFSTMLPKDTVVIGVEDHIGHPCVRWGCNQACSLHVRKLGTCHVLVEV